MGCTAAAGGVRDGRCTPRLSGLRSPRPVLQLTPHCAEAVYEEQEEEAKDWAVDPVLHKACSADVDSFCSDSDDDEEGAVTKCLVSANAHSPGWLVCFETGFARGWKLACVNETQGRCVCVAALHGVRASRPVHARPPRRLLLQIEHIGQLSIFCSDALHHAEEQRSGDVRLDRALYQGCSSEMNLFCEGVGYGASRAGRAGV